jgi:molybdopterin-guanine dinucleotide biosynthesis protein B
MYLGFCGPSNSGKTTMIVQLIERLRDYRVAVVKHTPHGIDVEGKDSAKFKEAGAGEVILLNGEAVHFRKGESLFSILKSLADYDIILVEGFKKYKFLPKVCIGIECENCIMRDPSVDDVLSYILKEVEIERIQKELPNFNCGECGHKNCREMAEAIYRGEDNFKGCRYWNPHATISVKVNGKEIYMGRFAQDVVIKTVIGMLSAFKGPKEPREVEIKFKVKDEK